MNFNIVDQNKYYLQIGEWATQMSPLALKLISTFLEEQKERTKKKLRIMEFGSGVSTIWFGMNFPDVGIYSVEGDKRWYNKVSKWIKQRKLETVSLVYKRQNANYRLRDVVVNDDYIYPFNVEGGWDLIINDGAIRETIGDTTMECADSLLKKGGLYLRHDYEKATKGDWLQTGWDSLGYDRFCGSHKGYELLTVSGNGKWGYKCEFGGIWRKPSL